VRRHPISRRRRSDDGRARARELDKIKAGEEGREGIFHDVGAELPAFLRARKVQERAAAIGFDYGELSEALADLASELSEVVEAVEVAGQPAPGAEPDNRVAEEIVTYSLPA